MERDEAHLLEETAHSEEIFSGELLTVFRDQARLAGGQLSTREWIKHPGASAIVPLFEDGTTILLRQFRYPPRRVFWEVPAGKLDRVGEPPEAVAERELEEETGWQATTFTHLSSTYACIGYSNEVIHFYLAEGLSKGQMALEDAENVDPIMMPFGEAVRMALHGEIQDMKTVVALVQAHAFLMKRKAASDVERSLP